MSYEKYKDAIKTTNKARRIAVRRLIENHRQEFDLLYIDEAAKHGLNPTKTKAQVERVELEREATDGKLIEIETI